MASVTIFGESKRAVVKVKDVNAPLMQVLESFCEKYKIDPNIYALKHYNRVLDLSLPYRYCNIPNKAQLEIIRSNKSRTPVVAQSTEGPSTSAAVSKPAPVVSSVNVGFQFANGERVISSFPADTSIWQIMLYWESTGRNITELVQTLDSGALVYCQPVFSFVNREYNRFEDLDMTLMQLGLRGGSCLFRIAHKLLLDRDWESDIKPFIQQKKAATTVPQVNNGTTANTSSTTPVPAAVASPIATASTASPSTPTQVPTAATEAVVEQQQQQQPQQQQSEPRQQQAGLVISLTDGVAKDVKFFQPSGYIPNMEIPDDFFEVTAEDIRSVMAQAEARKKEEEVFKTRAQREADAQKRERKYTKTLIRVRMPTGVLLQATFTPDDTLQSVKQFVQACVVNPQAPFNLYTAPPKRVFYEYNSTLRSLGLVPAVVLNLSPEDPLDVPTLRPEYMEHLQHSIATEQIPTCDEPITNNSASTSSSTGSGRTVSGKTGGQPKWLKIGK